MSIKKTNTSRLQEQDKIDYAKYVLDAINTPLRKKTSAGRGGRVFPSAAGNPCDRALWLGFYGQIPGGEQSDFSTRIFDHGNATEDRYFKYLGKAGLLIPGKNQREIVVSGRLGKGEYPIKGRIDFLCLIENEKFAIELKTAKKSDFDALAAPMPHHAIQLQLYLNLGDIPRGGVLYECKDNQTQKLFPLEKSESVIKNLSARVDRVLTGPCPPLESVEAIHDVYCDCRKVADEDVKEIA